MNITYILFHDLEIVKPINHLNNNIRATQVLWSINSGK